MTQLFDLRERLTSWFLRRDRDVTLPSGKKIAVSSANIEISNGNLTITTGNITITGTVDGVDISAHAANSDAHHAESHTLASHTGQLSHDTDLTDVSANDHHNQSHVLATGSALGPDHTISGAADGQVLRASGSTSARFDPLGHGDLSGVTADQHHNESHTVASHSDTTATGSELNTLTDGSDASSLHDHDGRYFQESEFTHVPGSNSKPLESSSSGALILEGLTVNGPPSVAGILVTSSGVLEMEERAAPGTPASGRGRIYFKSSDSRLYYKNDAGTEYGPL